MQLTSHYHHLASMFVVEPMFSLSCEHMGSNMGHVLTGAISMFSSLERTWTYAQCHRGKLVLFANRQWKDSLLLSLRGVEKQVLCIESSPRKSVAARPQEHIDSLPDNTSRGSS
jgi:hypothetical protein